MSQWWYTNLHWWSSQLTSAHVLANKRFQAWTEFKSCSDVCLSLPTLWNNRSERRVLLNSSHRVLILKSDDACFDVNTGNYCSLDQLIITYCTYPTSPNASNSAAASGPTVQCRTAKAFSFPWQLYISSTNTAEHWTLRIQWQHKINEIQYKIKWGGVL